MEALSVYVTDRPAALVRGLTPDAGIDHSDLEKLVEYEGRERSQDFRQAMADVVRPFYKVLKGEPKSRAEQ